MAQSIIKIASAMIAILAGFYIAATTIIFVPYYNWQYAREHGFAEWLLFGEVISTAKSFAWPYFMISPSSPANFNPVFPSQRNWSAQEIANSKHFLFSIQADLQSKKLSADRAGTGVTISERNEIFRLKQTALREVRLVDEATLRKIYPDLPYHVAVEYIPALESLIISLTSPSGNQEATQRGVQLFDAWVDWWNANKEGIYIPE